MQARKGIARDLREGLLELGPTFIKLGQVPSSSSVLLSSLELSDTKVYGP